MVLYGYYIMGASIGLLIICIFLRAFGFDKLWKPLGTAALMSLGAGVALVYVGPWLAWIFAAVAITIAVGLAYVASMNWRRWLTRAEKRWNLELDNKPNSPEDETNVYRNKDK